MAYNISTTSDGNVGLWGRYIDDILIVNSSGFILFSLLNDTKFSVSSQASKDGCVFGRKKGLTSDYRKHFLLEELYKYRLFYGKWFKLNPYLTLIQQ